jgi:glycerol-3-phosphate dehydrogenase
MENIHLLELEDGKSLAARWVINAAGLDADTVDGFFGEESFTVKPRRGELIVFDKFARSLIERILLPVPTELSKGVLIAPTVFGNVLLGPTADDVEDKRETGSTATGIERLLEHGRRILPALLDEEVTAVYAGLRAGIGASDYRIELDPERSYVCVAGIRSTGLTSSLGIAEYVRLLLAEAGLPLRRRRQHKEIQLPPISESMLRPYQDAGAIALDADYGRIVCHCERVTVGEVRDSFRAPVPAANLDGVRRRTRAQLGRCQGFYCWAALASLVEDARDVHVG